LHNLINKSQNKIDQHKSRDNAYKYDFLYDISLNITLVYNILQYKDFKNRVILIITFKFDWNSVLQLTFNKFYIPKKKKGQTKDPEKESL
jgi:hypothetical protein